MTAAAPATAADLSGLLPESPFFEDGLADLEALHGRRDPAIGHHLEHDLGDLFLGRPDVQGCPNMHPQLLQPVEHRQRGDRA
jgi:hypothetical protein